jgi:UDP-N-acetylglucosamine:LPS N-acetylglucosamine transferase
VALAVDAAKEIQPLELELLDKEVMVELLTLLVAGVGAGLLRLAQMVRQAIPALVVMALHQQSPAHLSLEVAAAGVVLMVHILAG